MDMEPRSAADGTGSAADDEMLPPGIAAGAR